MDILKLRIDESYRAIAPKRLVAQLPAEAPPPRPRQALVKTKKKANPR